MRLLLRNWGPPGRVNRTGRLRGMSSRARAGFIERLHFELANSIQQHWSDVVAFLNARPEFGTEGKNRDSLPEAANFPVAGIPDGNKLAPSFGSFNNSPE